MTDQPWAPRDTKPYWQWVEEEMAKPPKKWLIRDFIMEEGVTLISGPPKRAYKSWTMFMFHQMLIAGQGRWGFEVKRPVKSWIIELEGPPRTTAERQIVLKNSLGLDRSHEANSYFTHLSGHSLDNEKDLAEILRYVEQEGIEVLWIDSMSKALSSGSENDAAAVNRMFKNVERIRKLGCAVVFIHHVTKLPFDASEDEIDVDRMVRGSSAIVASYDNHIGVIPHTAAGTPGLRWVRRSKESGEKEFRATWDIQEDAEDRPIHVHLSLTKWDESAEAEVSRESFIDTLIDGAIYSKQALSKAANVSDGALKELIEACEIQGILTQTGGGQWKATLG